MLHAGLDLSRRRLDVCLVDEAGGLVEHTAAPPEADGLRHLVARLRGQPVRAVIASMTGARFIDDTLEELGWEVLVADAQKVKGGWRRWRARPTGSTRACWRSCRGAIWCRRSGFPTRRFAASASSPAIGCTWSVIARR
jgi:hypothetical protein